MPPLSSSGFLGPEFVRDGVLAAIAECFSSGSPASGDRYYYPTSSPRSAAVAGMRASIGCAVGRDAIPLAKSPREYLTKGCSSVMTTRASVDFERFRVRMPPAPVEQRHFARVATLADARRGIRSTFTNRRMKCARPARCQHGMRPIGGCGPSAC